MRHPLATLTVLLAAASGATAAPWTPPVPVSGPSLVYPSGMPVLDVAADGTAVLAWQRGSGGSRTQVEAAQRLGPSGPFEAPSIVDEGTPMQFAGPAVAALPGGRALVGWARHDVRPGWDAVATLGLGVVGTPSTPQELAPLPHLGRVAVGLASTGRVVTAMGSIPMTGTPGGVWRAAASGADDYPSPTPLADGVVGADVAMAADGTRITAWVAHGRLMAVIGDALPTDLGPAAGMPGVAALPGGKVAVAWCGPGMTVRTHGGTTWSTPVVIDHAEHRPLCRVDVPAVTMTDAGDLGVAWRARTPDGLGVVAAGRVGGSWRPAVLVARGPRNVGRPSLVMGRSGGMLVAWSHPLGTTASAVAARARTATGAWGPRELIRRARARLVAPDLGIDARGRVTLSMLTVPLERNAGLRVLVTRRVAPLP